MKRLALLPVLLVTLVACSDDTKSGSTPTTVPADLGYTVLNPAEGKGFLAAEGSAATVIDVRTPDEFAGGHLEGAVNSDLEGGQFSTFIKSLDKNAVYVVYCHSGRRAALAAQAMVDAGFTKVYDLGGIVDLQAAGYSVVQ